MSTSTRLVFVDDADTSITYDGDWFVRADSFAENGNGLAYHGAQHGTNSSGSLSFTFTGSRVRVMGTSNTGTTPSKLLDPTWKCLVDGNDIGISKPSNSPQNRWPLCSSSSLLDGAHTLVISAEVELHTFWIDQIQYLPSPSAKASIDRPTVAIQPSDPSIKYLAGNWQSPDSDPDSILTTDIGATLNLTFTGTKLTWVGAITDGYPVGPSSATYSLDGQIHKDFTVDPLPEGSNEVYHKSFFETDTLPNGIHTLIAAYHGPSAPLYLDYFLVEDGDIIIPSFATIKHAGAPVGAIVGGVIGGLALLGTLLLSWFLLQRRWEKKREAERVHIDPFPGNEVANFSAIQPVYQPTPMVTRQSTCSKTRPESRHDSPPLLSPRAYQDIIPKGYWSGQQSLKSSKGESHSAGSSKDCISDTPITVVHHRDSGIRLDRPPAQVLDVPPSYTRT